MSASLTSMTGYASHEMPFEGGLYRIHLKSINHRAFELRWRAPREWFAFESRARKIFQERLLRGSLECWIEHLPTPGAENTSSKLQSALNQLKLALDQSQKLKPLPSWIRALILAALPEIWLEHREGTPTLAPQDADFALEECAQKLSAVRQKEGLQLKDCLLHSQKQLTVALGHIEKQLPPLVQQTREAWKNRVEQLSKDLALASPQTDKMWEEFLLLAEKRDVEEELSRIKIHLAALEEWLLAPPSQAGRRLEFLAQELVREWTTLGNKIREPALLENIMNAKLELDRIREQSANIV